MTVTSENTGAAATVVGAPASVTRGQVEDFLYAEAELLDAWDLDTWITLYTEDCRYVVPATTPRTVIPRTTSCSSMTTACGCGPRVERLNSRKAHREYPHSATSHQVTNVRLRPVVG